MKNKDPDAPTFTLLYSTFPDLETAKRITHTLLEKKLIACANIVENGTSIYGWNDKIQEDRECYALFKTTEEHSPEIEKLILELHPYDTPCLFEIPIQRGSAPYLAWIHTQLAPITE